MRAKKIFLKRGERREVQRMPCLSEMLFSIKGLSPTISIGYFPLILPVVSCMAFVLWA